MQTFRKRRAGLSATAGLSCFLLSRVLYTNGQLKKSFAITVTAITVITDNSNKTPRARADVRMIAFDA